MIICVCITHDSMWCNCNALGEFKMEIKMSYSQSWQFQLRICRAKRRLFSEEEERTCGRESLLRKAHWGPERRGIPMNEIIRHT